MDSFYLSVEEITELASYRVPFESKLRILIPDKGDTTKDTLAVKLKSLNYILSPSEINASMKFRYDIQQLAHGINPFNSQDGLKKFKSNHKTVTEVIDRLIEVKRAANEKMWIAQQPSIITQIPIKNTLSTVESADEKIVLEEKKILEENQELVKTEQPNVNPETTEPQADFSNTLDVEYISKEGSSNIWIYFFIVFIIIFGLMIHLSNSPYNKLKPKESADQKNMSDTIPDKEEEHHVDKTYKVVDQTAQFPEGDEAMMKFIHQNINYPHRGRINNEEGIVTVNFIVNADGTLEDIKVKKGLTDDLNIEVLRVIKLLPPFIPAKVHGQKVRSIFSVPIRFKDESLISKTDQSSYNDITINKSNDKGSGIQNGTVVFDPNDENQQRAATNNGELLFLIAEQWCRQGEPDKAKAYYIKGARFGSKNCIRWCDENEIGYNIPVKVPPVKTRMNQLVADSIRDPGDR